MKIVVSIDRNVFSKLDFIHKSKTFNLAMGNNSGICDVKPKMERFS